MIMAQPLFLVLSKAGFAGNVPVGLAAESTGGGGVRSKPPCRDCNKRPVADAANPLEMTGNPDF
ncbi:hypothetical protein [Nitrospirillum amazonense]|uniref:hypothetical protein n=1 Tax=Nitrospirillum amazonense TaxID=28077 RepID=UPI00119F96F9|nr:hypothetical protein [Nitrospirillum amazonense]